VNDGGLLTDQATQYGLAYPGRGRTPLWFDYDRDGKLDVLPATWRVLTASRPRRLAQRGGPDDVSQTVGLGASGNAFFAQITGRRSGDPPS
jgi:hypothetical protein